MRRYRARPLHILALSKVRRFTDGRPELRSALQHLVNQDLARKSRRLPWPERMQLIYPRCARGKRQRLGGRSVWSRDDFYADGANRVSLMSCPSCGHENPPVEFCTAWARACGAVTTAEPRSYTPRHLVEKILAPRRRSRRAQACHRPLRDVARSRELAERLDPEEWHRLLDLLFRILADGVPATRKRSTNIPATASWPSSAPPSPRGPRPSGLRAALEMARELQRSPTICARERLDLADPDGLTRARSSSAESGTTCAWTTPPRSTSRARARVAQAGPARRVSVTEQTARLASGFFDFLDRGEQSLKGAAFPCGVRPAGLGPIRSRLERSRARASLASFAASRTHPARAGPAEAAVRSPKVVLITAEAGAEEPPVYEFVERTRGWPSTMRAALPMAACSPSDAIVQLARGLFRRPRRRVGGVVPRRRGARPGGAHAVDPIALAFWLELLGRPTPRWRLRAGARDAPRAPLPVTSRSDLRWRSTRAHAALDRACTGSTLPGGGPGDADRGSPAPRCPTAGCSCSQPRVPSICPRGPQGRAFSLCPRSPRLGMLVDDWLGPDRAHPAPRPIEARARGNPLSSRDRLLARRTRRAARRTRCVRAGRPGEEIPCPRPFRRPRLAHRFASRSATRTCSRPRRGGTRRADGAAPCRGRSPEPELAASRERLATRAPRSRRSSWGACLPAPHARSGPTHTAAGSPAQTHAGVAQALLRDPRICGPGARHAPRPSLREAGEHLEAARWHEHAGRRGARSDPADGVRHCRRVTKLLAALPESHETLIASSLRASAARDRPHRMASKSVSHSLFERHSCRRATGGPVATRSLAHFL